MLLLLSGFAAKSQVAVTPSSPGSASNTSATSKIFASAGCVELGGSFSFTSESSSPPNGGSSSPAATTLLFAPYVGYFPVQELELGINPLSVLHTSDGFGGSTTSLLFVFAPSYNFSTHSIAYPFIEGNIGYNSSSESGYNSISGVCYGARAGVKLALAPHALLDIALQYIAHGYSSNGVSYGTINDLVVGIGFSVNL